MSTVKPSLLDNEKVKRSNSVSDALDKSDVQGWRYLAYMWPMFMLCVLALAALPMLITALNLNWDGFLAGLAIIAVLGGFAFVFLGLQAMLGHFVFRFQLPREVKLQNGVLTVSQRGKIKEYSIAGCKWHEGSVLIDNIEMFTRIRRGIVLHTPEGRIAIGHCEGSVEQWRTYLTDAGVPQTRPWGCLTMIAWGLAGLLVGCVLGITMGYAMTAAGYAPMSCFGLSRCD